MKTPINDAHREYMLKNMLLFAQLKDRETQQKPFADVEMENAIIVICVN